MPLSAAELTLDHTNKLFRIVYITLTGEIDTIFPTAGLWSWVGKSMSYLIKLVTILWCALPTQSAPASSKTLASQQPRADFLTHPMVTFLEKEHHSAALMGCFLDINLHLQHLTLLAIFKQAPGPPRPRDSFLVEGRLPCGNNNAYQDLPSGLAQLQEFMDDVHWTLPLGNQSPLLLTAPAPIEVDTNASPSEEPICQSMTRMDNGADNKGQKSQLLDIQHPFAEISTERFLNISLVNLDQLHKDL
ncbi:hypothetical protein DSO57_1024426 [Entomophthora muscae]|uniref:Uncharacterized protein n=1 Tax=Entomophthora muscae TaxID=34485 RepID=A0ACC2TDQ0_9FUNG|nr:hypothetical protein DSO57_1024426 [Entomophthora muscae]